MRKWEVTVLRVWAGSFCVWSLLQVFPSPLLPTPEKLQLGDRCCDQQRACCIPLQLHQQHLSPSAAEHWTGWQRVLWELCCSSGLKSEAENAMSEIIGAKRSPGSNHVAT